MAVSRSRWRRLERHQTSSAVKVNWANALWVDPTNDQRLVVGGMDLYRSTDGGSTLTLISGLIPGVAYTTHVDNHAIVSVPDYDGSTVKTVFLANDGGVYKAADITTATISSGWTDLNNGLAVTQFYSVATNVATGSIVGGTQDNATLRTSGSGTTWSGAHGSDGGFVAHDPVNTNYYYFGMLGLRIFRNETDGTGFGPENHRLLVRPDSGCTRARAVHWERSARTGLSAMRTSTRRLCSIPTIRTGCWSAPITCS